MKYKNLNNRHLFLLALLIIGIGSCKKDDFLSVAPKGVLTSVSTFSSQSNADLFVNNIYNRLPGLQGSEVLDQWTDNSECGATWMEGVTKIRNNGLSSGNSTGGPSGIYDWGTNYTSIRACNSFLTDAAANKNTYSATWYAQRVAEVRFLRAFYYSQLFVAYGGVPLITKPLSNLDGSDIFTARSTVEQTLAFIEADCDAAAADLPLNQGTGDLGRATQGAALALKGWVELFYASPLLNTNNDAARWAKAAATNLSVMNLGVYKLFNPSGSKTAFKDQFLGVNNFNPEQIFVKTYALPSKGSNREGTLGPVFVNGGQQAWGNLQPTQSLVDDYEMDNGKPISDPASGYDPQQPYVHRESRFYQSVVYDGSVWQNFVWTSRIGGNNQIDLGSTSDVSNTGYNARKTLDESILGQTSLSTSPSIANYQYFRYAEILLSYAEAQNEAVGPDASVYTAVNLVRDRVFLPALPPGLSQADMRANIRRERRLELTFEDKRWNDIRRWDITVKGPAVLNKPEYGMVITPTNGTLVYKPTIVFQNSFSEYKNWLPIPQGVLQQNPKLTQNAGY
ncbi:MAG: RagB/SusD family nutrient uptake outer membrane protein [Mucilaginibacter sp.]|uniref:RagB/SusD family nutrient uptake outer membrane protein n=1 Tax=Mucilaginibacter sp. TaxID=1882438 RepID=UPI0034E4058E